MNRVCYTISFIYLFSKKQHLDIACTQIEGDHFETKEKWEETLLEGVGDSWWWELEDVQVK